MMERNCDTCMHKADESRDDDGNRIVSCEINEGQMFFPFAEDCKHWERANNA
jgi:hypothetical protein